MSGKRYASIHPDYDWSGENDYDDGDTITYPQFVHSQPLLIQAPTNHQILRGSRLVSSYRPNIVYTGGNIITHQAQPRRAYATAQPDYNWQETHAPQLRTTMYNNVVSAPLLSYRTNPGYVTTTTGGAVVLNQGRSLTPLRQSSHLVVNSVPQTHRVVSTGLRASSYITQDGGVQIVGNNKSSLRKSHMELRGSYNTTTVLPTTTTVLRGSNYATLRGSNHSVRRVVHNPVTTTEVLRGSQHGVRRIVTHGNLTTVQPGVVTTGLRASNLVVTQGNVVQPTIEQIRGSRMHVVHQQQQQNLGAQVENLGNELRGSKFRNAPPPPAE